MIKRHIRFPISLLFSVFLSLTFSLSSHATQDVEEPEQVIELIRLVMSQPLVTAEVHRLTEAGCKWENQTFWSGSPSEEQLKTRIFWMNFSMQMATQSGATYWKSFSFSRKNDGPVLEIIDATDLTRIVDCSD